jgi:transcriptional regulator of aromatic amino acid metabolism
MVCLGKMFLKRHWQPGVRQTRNVLIRAAQQLNSEKLSMKIAIASERVRVCAVKEKDTRNIEVSCKGRAPMGDLQLV